MKFETCRLIVPAVLLFCAGLWLGGAEPADAETYTSIGIDGNVQYDPPAPGGTTWEQDEQMQSVYATYFYITWDATNIYVAFTALDTGVGDVCVAFDTGPGGTTDAHWGAGFGADNAPEYFIGVTEGGYMEYRFGDAGGWQDPQNVTANPAWGFFAGWAGQPNTEIQIPRSWLGSPSAFRVMAWTVNNAQDTVWTAFPIPSEGGPSPGAAPVIFDMGYYFSDGGAGIAPLNDFSPTLVELDSFTAVARETTVLVEWATLSEIDAEGFHLWRSDRVDGEYDRISQAMIPARGDAIQGAEYEYVDLEVVVGRTYWYKLEDFDIYGHTKLHGPVEASLAPMLCGVVAGDPGRVWAPGLAALAALAVLGFVVMRRKGL